MIKVIKGKSDLVRDSADKKKCVVVFSFARTGCGNKICKKQRKTYCPRKQ